MIVQCGACQTRFRLADEKIKPGGTKVRCSKCKEVFTVIPPEPEPVEDKVDFDSSNMEKLTEDGPDDVAPDSERLQTDSPEQKEQQTPPPESSTSQTSEASKQADSDELDFSSLESEMGEDSGSNDELADNFFFADTSQPAEAIFDEAGEDRTSAGMDFSTGDVPPEDHADEEPLDFSVASAEVTEPGGPVDFNFSEEEESDPETPEMTETDFSIEESTKPSEFSFEDPAEASREQNEPGEFSFDDEGDSAFNFDQAEDEATPAATQKDSEPGEFSFDDDDSVSAWSEEPSGDETSFSFEEAGFDTDDALGSSASTSDADGLQFGEIDFASDDESGAPSFQSNDDFPQATMPLEMETEASSRSQSSAPPPRNYDDEPLPAPPPAAKKSSLSRILVLLVLLLLILGGAAGYLFMQEGSLNLNTIARYLPFLQEYIGESPVISPGDQIGITIIESSYVNGQAGQMLVIQGAAVNNHPTTRSAITVKGVLLDATGLPLLQQTVFCGNKLNNNALKSMSFAAIEEAMNNQFGDGLSNMNVSAGATIPFTIVFRNLPTGIASINVEVVDSKPGAS